MDASELKQIVEIFIHEGNEALWQFEHCILALEKEGSQELLLDKIIRTAHNLRASAATLGFTDIAEFMKHFEEFVWTLKRKEIEINHKVVSTLFLARDFLASQIEALRQRKKSPGHGENIIQAFSSAKELQSNALKPIVLPRAPEAGDIWFVDDNLKAELFEIRSDTPAPRPTAPNDPRVDAIQAEIARLTRLAAEVNLTTVQAADTATSETIAGAAATEAAPVSQAQEWSLGTLPHWTASPLKQDAPEVMHDETESIEVDANLSIDQKHEHVIDELKESADETPNSTDAPEAVPSTDQNEELREAGESEQFEAKKSIEPSINDSQSEPKSQPPTVINFNDIMSSHLSVNIDKVEQLSLCIEDLVLLQNIFEEHKGELQSPLLQKSLTQMSKAIRKANEIVRDMRLVSVQPMLESLGNWVQENSIRLGKNASVSLHGQELEIDKATLDKIHELLQQLVDNALKHGLENPEERIARGKNPQGQVKIKIYQRSRALVVEVSDDGRGLDSKLIRGKAIQQGLISSSERITEERIHSLIFTPGFSSRADIEAAEIGAAGLARVNENIKSMQGRIELESMQDEGTTVRLTLPLTVAVMDGFVIRLGQERYVFDKSQIVETIQAHEADVNLVQGRTQLLNFNGSTIPLYHLAALLHGTIPAQHATTSYQGVALVVEQNSSHRFAIVVDDILAQQQVVIRKLGRQLRGITGIDGAAILGDGRPAIIIDLYELVAAQQKGLLSTPRKGKAA